MSQQQVNFDPDNQGGAPLYETGYQDATHNSDYSSNLPGQKLSWRDTVEQPTAGQRLALAIVSLVILLVFFLAIIVLLATGAFASSIAQSVAPSLGYMGLGLVITVIVVNVIFNRRH